MKPKTSYTRSRPIYVVDTPKGPIKVKMVRYCSMSQKGKMHGYTHGFKDSRMIVVVLKGNSLFYAGERLLLVRANATPTKEPSRKGPKNWEYLPRHKRPGTARVRSLRKDEIEQ